jgi:hypothetical protein
MNVVVLIEAVGENRQYNLEETPEKGIYATIRELLVEAQKLVKQAYIDKLDIQHISCTVWNGTIPIGYAILHYDFITHYSTATTSILEQIRYFWGEDAEIAEYAYGGGYQSKITFKGLPPTPKK